MRDYDVRVQGYAVFLDGRGLCFVGGAAERAQLAVAVAIAVGDVGRAKDFEYGLGPVGVCEADCGGFVVEVGDAWVFCEEVDACLDVVLGAVVDGGAVGGVVECRVEGYIVVS